MIKKIQFALALFINISLVVTEETRLLMLRAIKDKKLFLVPLTICIPTLRKHYHSPFFQ